MDSIPKWLQCALIVLLSVSVLGGAVSWFMIAWAIAAFLSRF